MRERKKSKHDEITNEDGRDGIDFGKESDGKNKITETTKELKVNKVGGSDGETESDRSTVSEIDDVSVVLLDNGEEANEGGSREKDIEVLEAVILPDDLEKSKQAGKKQREEDDKKEEREIHFGKARKNELKKIQKSVKKKRQTRQKSMDSSNNKEDTINEKDGQKREVSVIEKTVTPSPQEPEEIVEICECKRTKKGVMQLLIKWDNGEKWKTTSDNVIADAYDLVVDYLEKRKGDERDLKQLSQDLVRCARTKKKRAQASKIMDELYAEIDDEVIKETQHSKCNHRELTELEMEINSNTCGKGFKLHDCCCATCGVKMVRKLGELEGEGTGEGTKKGFQPSVRTPVYMCHNIYSCKYVLCCRCYGKCLLEKAEKDGGGRHTRRRNN